MILWIIESLDLKDGQFTNLNEPQSQKGNVVRNYDAILKICLESFSHNNWARWYDFKERLLGEVANGRWLLEEGKWLDKH